MALASFLLKGLIVGPLLIVVFLDNTIGYMYCETDFAELEADPYLKANGYNPAPDWFVPALKALPLRTLTKDELETMNRDGGILVKNLIGNDRVLEALRSTFTHKANLTTLWTVNGLMNALVRHSPLPALSSSAFGGKATTIWNAQSEPRPPKSERDRLNHSDSQKAWYDINPGTITSTSVHNDVGAYVGGLHTAGFDFIPLFSAFVALTDIPYGLVLLAGSHHANRRHKCPAGPLFLNHDCMDKLETECNGTRSWDMKPGDALLFWGEVYHWTNMTPQARQAISIRYVPADHVYTGKLVSQVNHAVNFEMCKGLGGHAAYPILYPPEQVTHESDWPVWAVCPPMRSFSSWIAKLRKAIKLTQGSFRNCDGIIY